MKSSSTSEAEQPGLAEALVLLAEQSAQLATMGEALRLMAERGPTSLPTARGAGERVTVAALVKKAQSAMGAGTSRTYLTYMNLLSEGDQTLAGPDGLPWNGIGSKWADEVLCSELNDALVVVKRRAARQAEARALGREAAGRTVRRATGEGACYNAIGAWRFLFEVAIQDRHVAEGLNPATKLKKPKRRKGGRRMALEAEHYEAMVQLISSTGDDPELDAMILLFLDVTGARQEGVLNLSFDGIDADECTVRLEEKFETVVDQPVPDWFVSVLIDFAQKRGAVGRGDKVFRKRVGPGSYKAITPRRFNYIFGDRLQASFVWADRLQVTAHTLRHHATTNIERHAGSAVSTAFARHAPTATNQIYTEASQTEVARAVVELHGGDHPWLHRQPRPRR